MDTYWYFHVIICLSLTCFVASQSTQETTTFLDGTIEPTVAVTVFDYETPSTMASLQTVTPTDTFPMLSSSIAILMETTATPIDVTEQTTNLEATQGVNNNTSNTNASTTDIMLLFDDETTEPTTTSFIGDNFNDASGGGSGDFTSAPSIDTTSDIDLTSPPSTTATTFVSVTTQDDMESSGISTEAPEESTSSVTIESVTSPIVSEQTESETTVTVTIESTTSNTLTDLPTTDIMESSGETFPTTTDNDSDTTLLFTTAFDSTSSEMQPTESPEISTTILMTAVDESTTVADTNTDSASTTDLMNTTASLANTTSLPSTNSATETTANADEITLTTFTEPVTVNENTTMFEITTFATDISTDSVTNLSTEDATDSSGDFFFSTMISDTTTNAFTTESMMTSADMDEITTFSSVDSSTSNVTTGFTDEVTSNSSVTEEVVISTIEATTMSTNTTSLELTSSFIDTTSLPATANTSMTTSESAVTSFTEGSGDLFDTTLANGTSVTQTTLADFETSTLMTTATVPPTSQEAISVATESDITTPSTPDFISTESSADFDMTSAPIFSTMEQISTTEGSFTTETILITQDALTSTEEASTIDTTTTNENLTTIDTLTTDSTPTIDENLTTIDTLTTDSTPTIDENLTTIDTLTTDSTPTTNENLTTIDTLTTDSTPTIIENLTTIDTLTTDSATGVDITTQGTSTTPVVTADSIAVVELELGDGSAINSDDLATALSQAYAEISQGLISSARRRKRATSSSTTMNNIVYNVTLIEVGGRNASFYVFEGNLLDGSSTIPTAAFVAGNLLNNPVQVLNALRANNINALSAIFFTDGVCKNNNQLVAIGLHLVNTNSSQLDDFTKSESFLARMTEGLRFLRSYSGSSSCLQSIPSFSYEICGVYVQNNCDVIITFLEDSATATAASTIDGFAQNSFLDLQIYGVALQAYTIYLPYVFTVSDLTSPPAETVTTVAPPVVITDIQSWCIPVIIALAVICFLLIILLIIFIYLYCRRRKGKDDEPTPTAYREIHVQGKAVASTPNLEGRDLKLRPSPQLPVVKKLPKKRREPQTTTEPHYFSEAIRKRDPPPQKKTFSESDDTTSSRSYRKRNKPKRIPTPEAPPIDPSDSLFQPTAVFSNTPSSFTTDKFHTSIIPVSLPPIQTPLVSDQLRQNISRDSDPNIPLNATRNGLVHTFDPKVEEDIAGVYDDAQRKIDQALEPTEPSIFNKPNRKKIRNRRGKADIAHPQQVDPDIEAVTANSKPGHYHPKSTQHHPAPDTPKPTAPSSETARMKIAALLDDAFSLVSPRRGAISPVLLPQNSASPPPHERGSSAPPLRGDPLFTKVQPLIHTPRSGDGPYTYFAPPSATPSGKPTYITPIKKVPDSSGEKNGAWTPYRAFDEVSKIRNELENPISPLGHHPHYAPTLSRQPVSSSSSGGASDPIHSSALPDDAEDDDEDANLKSSAALLVKGIKDEISKLANRPSPVRPFSSSS